ncbi:MAG: hypothetical protein KAJ53_06455 [Anaerolineales bacterium]|nr:hypothetical protein [Anaerolineales bacterium]
MTTLVANSRWQRLVTYVMLLILLTGCSGGASETVQEGLSIPIAAESMTPTSSVTLTPTATPTATPRASFQDGLLSIISPLENSEVSGGANLVIQLHLVDHDDLPVEAAVVQADIWHPGGELFTGLSCIDKGKGRYLSENVSLPLRGASGTWQVIGKATWQDGQQAKTDRTFQVNPSISEMYQNRHGFWIEHPRIFGLGTGFYNLHGTGGLHFEDWLNKDGSGYVILDNYRYVVMGVTFATLEVHWQHVDFPTDGAAAIAYAENLARTGLHHQDPDTPLTKLTAKKVTFQDRSAWQVLGRGSEFYVAKAAAEYPVEWLIFQCPGLDWLWSLVISADNVGYMNHLRAVQKTFECPPVNPN